MSKIYRNLWMDCYINCLLGLVRTYLRGSILRGVIGMFFINLFYIFIGVIIWSIVTQPGHNKKVQEEEEKQRDLETIRLKVEKLEEEIEMMRKGLD
jgi:hypothetical protein